MADGRVIMARDTNLTALLPGLAAAMPLALTSVGQAQETLAQADTQVVVETFEGASTSLRTQFANLVRHSGKVLTFAPDAALGAAEAGRFVLYAPLNRLWLLDEAGQVTRHARIEVRQSPFDHLVLHWTHWSDVDVSDILPAATQMPTFAVESDTPHPLAAQYDALLSRPLARATGSLPVGAYFSTSGHVFDAGGAQIAEWDSFGAEIALRLVPAETEAEASNDDQTALTVETETNAETDATKLAPNAKPVSKPLWQWFAVADLAAALSPKQPQGDQ